MSASVVSKLVIQRTSVMAGSHSQKNDQACSEESAARGTVTKTLLTAGVALQLDAGDGARPIGQALGHRVGVAGVAQPEVVGEQGLELGD